MFYFVKTPWYIRKYYSGCVWNMPADQKIIYLSFDDGPHAQATPFILNQLRAFGAKATFFCIGKNVLEEPVLYKNILAEGHRVGNHTHNHINGWKKSDKEYFENIQLAAKYIDSDLFRPPYGRISKFQIRHLTNDPLRFRIIMWDVLSADFDKSISGEECALNVIRNTRPGSIVIFHDSAKAFDRMNVALPNVLEHFSQLGFSFRALQ
jgi:peptidoglycan/xylan/chitin deacetylase (PgdA/CDA1 family)